MAVAGVRLSVFLLSLYGSYASSYMQFVVPGVTKAASSSVYDFGGTYYCWPNRTVDGNFDQNIRTCLHTATTGVTAAWLRIDLQTVRSVKSVKFWYRNDRDDASTHTIRLLGYSIRGSNSTTVSLSNTKVCYTDPAVPILPTVIEVECKVTARYIWFYQSNAQEKEVPMLEICEVQVFGCDTGFYGENCSKMCNQCNNSESCDIDTGQCDDNGCVSYRYQPPKCTECFPGFYGADCGTYCSPFCRTYYCDQVSGACLHYCQNGYIGPYCNYTCPKGLYGEYCSKHCGNCLQNTTCNHGNGSCPFGCDAGYKGQYCTTSCSDGEFGRNCLHKCSENCLDDEVCDRVDGHCESCVPGFEGLKCDENCKNRTYGEGCSKQCGGCLHGEACHHISGRCEFGCDPGWQKTDECNTPCENGTFGQYCVHKCEGHCHNDEPCNTEDGTCSKCSQGWIGEFCNTTGKRANEEMKQSLGVVVGPLIGAIVIIISVAFAGFMFRKRRKSKETNEQEDDKNIYDLPTKGDNVYDHAINISSRD